MQFSPDLSVLSALRAAPRRAGARATICGLARRAAAAAAVTASVGGAVWAQQAQPVAGEAAAGMLFAPEQAEVRVLDKSFLKPEDARILAQVGQTQKYYGAIAISPEEGLVSEATVAAANYHDVETAGAVALEGCNARRTIGQAPCEVVAEIRPKGWSPQPLQLSSDATQSYVKSYRDQNGPKVFAISRETGQWAMAMGQDAAEIALAGCRLRSGEKGGTAACSIAVRD